MSISLDLRTTVVFVVGSDTTLTGSLVCTGVCLRTPTKQRRPHFVLGKGRGFQFSRVQSGGVWEHS